MHISDRRLWKRNFPEIEQRLFKWNNNFSNQLIITSIFNCVPYHAAVTQLPCYWTLKNIKIISYIYIYTRMCTQMHTYTHNYTQVRTHVQRNLLKTELLLHRNLLLFESPLSIRGNHWKLASNKWIIIKGEKKQTVKLTVQLLFSIHVVLFCTVFPEMYIKGIFLW